MVVPHASTLGLFAAAALALLLVPGPVVLYVVVQSVERGRRVGLASVAGAHLGTLVHVVAAVAGVSAVVATSAVAFSAVKYAGAVYVVYLGVRRLLARGAAEPQRAQRTVRGAFLRGAVVNVLNPKTALFFLAFLPQFVDPGRGAVWSQVASLGLLFIALGLVTDSLYAFAAAGIGRVLRRRRALLRNASGSVLIGLGAVTALASRN